MTEFKSNPAAIRKTASDIYIFLNDFNNFEKLMPEQVTNWQSSITNCSFTIKGMADLAMKMGNCNEFDLVTYLSISPSPFDFSLYFTISEKEDYTEVHCTLDASLNPMLKMMASRPLQNFVNLLAEKLKDTLESGN